MNYEKALNSLGLVDVYKIWIRDVNKVLFATANQAEKIIEMNNDKDLRNNLVKLDTTIFKPSSVIRMEQVKIEKYELPTYARKKIDEISLIKK